MNDAATSLAAVVADWREQKAAIGCACVDFRELDCLLARYPLPFDDIDRAAAYDEALENPCECACHLPDPDEFESEEDSHA